MSKAAIDFKEQMDKNKGLIKAVERGISKVASDPDKQKGLK